jgi:hypothetical protein
MLSYWQTFIMAQSLTTGGCSAPDILHPPLPHPKAVSTVLTPEGIKRGETQEPFPELSAGALCPCLITLRAVGIAHRCTAYEEESSDTSHAPMTGKNCPRLGIERRRSEPCINRGVLNIGTHIPHPFGTS